MLASMLAAEWSTVFQVLKFLTLQAGMLQGHRLVQSIVTLDYISFVILRYGTSTITIVVYKMFVSVAPLNCMHTTK